MAMKFNRSQINGSRPHPVGKELVVKQEETRETETLGWNKTKKWKKSLGGVIGRIQIEPHILIHGHLLSQFIACPDSWTDSL